jgi:hypothetical protein
VALRRVLPEPDAWQNEDMTGWSLRPIVWFATASMMTTVFHELTHAVVAYALGVRSTLHNYFVHLEPTTEQAASNMPAIIGVAGPSLCLVLGLVAWIAFTRARGSAAELPLLFVAVFGLATFSGNLVSASFVGDFSRAAIALHLPMPARYALSLAGVVGTAALHFRAGRELTRWVPPATGRLAGTLGIIVVPVIVGMAIVIIANIPSASPTVRIAEASFWIFAAIGAFVKGAADQPAVRGADPLRWADGAALLLAILIVRMLIRGISFVP